MAFASFLSPYYVAAAAAAAGLPPAPPLSLPMFATSSTAASPAYASRQPGAAATTPTGAAAASSPAATSPAHSPRQLFAYPLHHQSSAAKRAAAAAAVAAAAARLPHSDRPPAKRSRPAPVAAAFEPASDDGKIPCAFGCSFFRGFQMQRREREREKKSWAAAQGRTNIPDSPHTGVPGASFTRRARRGQRSAPAARAAGWRRREGGGGCRSAITWQNRVWARLFAVSFLLVLFSTKKRACMFCIGEFFFFCFFVLVVCRQSACHARACARM